MLHRLKSLWRHWQQPELSLTDLFPPIESEYAQWKHLFRGKILNAGAGCRDISSLVDGELFNQDIPHGHHNANIHIYSPLDSIPKPDGFFDVILCNAVLEHVQNPHEVLCEFYRVLRPGGVLYLSVPFIQPEHLDPTDFQRFTRDGLRQLCIDHGFEVEAVEGQHSLYATFGWLLMEWHGGRITWIKRFLYPWLRRKCRQNHDALARNGGQLVTSQHAHSVASAYRAIARKSAPSDPWLDKWAERAAARRK